MSSLGKLVGDIGGLAGDKGSYGVMRLTKNKELQGRLDTSLKDYDSTKASSSEALDQYIKNYLAGTKDAEVRSGQEIGVLDEYYNGGVENELARLRTSRADAARDAVTRALAYSTRGQNLARVGSDGGGSSYDRQLANKAATDIEVQNAMEQAALERGDWDYLQRSKLSMAGQRQAMSDALLARGLVPSNMRKDELGWNLSTLGDLLKLDNANKIYGTEYKPSTSEQIGGVVDDVAQIGADIYTMGGWGAAQGTPTFTGSSASPAGGWSANIAPITVAGAYSPNPLATYQQSGWNSIYDGGNWLR